MNNIIPANCNKQSTNSNTRVNSLLKTPNQKLQTFGFTLVELIVVIVILAILATIAFLSFSSQSSWARDSTRLSDIWSIKKWFEMYSVNSWIYPTPDGWVDITYSGWVLWTQWTMWDNAYKIIKNTLSKKVTDPLTSTEYTYSLASNKREYQVAVNLENTTSYNNNYNPLDSNSLISQFSSLNSTNALWWTWVNVYISGNFNSITLKTFTGSLYYIVASPTMVLSDTSTWNLKYENSIWNWKLLLNWTSNLAKFTDTLLYSSGSLPTDVDIPNLMNNLKLAYSWSNITSNPTIQKILSLSWTALTDMWKILVNNTLWWNVSTPTWWDTPSTAPTTYSCTWTLVIANANISNTTWLVANTPYQSTTSWNNCYYTCKSNYSSTNCETYTAPVNWACNNVTQYACSAWTSTSNVAGSCWWSSTWTCAWTNWWTNASCSISNAACQWKDISWTNCTNPDITIWSQVWAGCNSTLWTWIEYNVDQNCYNYQWWVVSWCDRSSTEKENVYNSTYWVDNIWWKLYTWAQATQANNACPTWWHLPSDNEWTTLELALAPACTDTASTGWRCTSSWIGWSWNSSKTSSNNIVQALKIPLWGYRDTDGSVRCLKD